ncbi:MAG: right-handed parallel beta-helix repeat-containing protein, partial [Candidatus Bathyarchaeota archaeon]|nr:right-handed parallel beta-helix repeat-containing protein [Candidatus Bathyarchaeota archaeon]
STKNSTITNNVLTSNDVCVYLEGSSNNNITQNTINDNFYGIHLKNSFNNNITHNSLARNDKGIYLYCSSGNCIQQNELVENSQGIDIFYSTCNVISANTFDANEQGISFNALISSYNERITVVYGSTNNSIVGNDILNNECGICVSLSSNNTFSGNNFVNNTNQVLIKDHSDTSNQGNGTDECYSEYAPANAWDNGKQGNYWSDYQEKDSDSDGIGDTPYVIDDNNKDTYPFMQLILLDSSPKDDSLNQDSFSQLLSMIVGFVTSWAGQLFLVIACFVVGLIAVLVVAAKRRRKLQNKQ